MPEEFQQTVDLKLKKEEKTKLRPTAVSAAKNARGIDQVFQDGKNETPGNLKKIEKYQEPRIDPQVLKIAVMLLMVAIISIAGYFLVYKTFKKNPTEKLSGWYAVKLINGEEYYGEIIDTKADPVVIKNVYYNYDQMKDGVVNKDYVPDPNQNIRLVKRGKEAHGPDGSMSIVRGQVVIMEPLKDDSKVLKAIIGYEKK